MGFKILHKSTVDSDDRNLSVRHVDHLLHTGLHLLNRLDLNYK